MKCRLKNHIASVLTTFSLSILLFGCFEESELEKLQKESDQQIADYLEANSIQALESNFGLFYEVLTENQDGEIPAAGDVLVVKYEMKKLDGTIIASEVSDSTLLRFESSNIAPDGVIYGLDVLKKGETIRFYLPSYVAFGSYHPEDHAFDEYENFIFDMELIDILSEEEINVIEINAINEYINENQITDMIESTSGLYFKSLTPGVGELAQPFDEVSIHFTRKYLDGTVIQKTGINNPLVVTLNQGQLVEGFGQGILNMNAGETALMIMPSNLAFGASVQVFPEFMREQLYDDRYINNLVAPYSPVIYEVQLIEIN
ncbi:MAG: FKBP-type peptidyl-prolyl cis-trans isomerase [Reichenbachiella sp.]